MRHNLIGQGLWSAVAMFALTGAMPAFADPASFTVDPARSSITISGKVAGNTLSEQGPGSLITTYQGQILVDLAGDSLQFIGGSQIQALTNGSWQPMTKGAPGSAPANYGGSVSLGFLGSAKAALRNLQFDALSSLLPMTNGGFDSSGLVFMFPTNASSVLDYNAGLFGADSKPLEGYATNRISAGAQFTTSGTTQTLLIPIDASHVFQLLSPNDSELILKGQLVATRSTAPSLKISSIAATNKVVTLKWPSGAGQSFQVWSAPDLKNWTVRQASVTGTAPATTWSGAMTTSNEFFKITQ